MKIIAYLRVSTRSQGDSGLGIEAQREYIARACDSGGWQIVGEYSEAVSGSIRPCDRAQYKQAAEDAKRQGATIMVAKIDRMSRDVEHIAGLVKRTPFKVATMPQADPLQFHIYAALAEQERAFIGQRTRSALAALKARAASGDAASIAKVENRTRGREAAHAKGNGAAVAGAVAKADTYAQSMVEAIKTAMFDGVTTLQQCADHLNSRGKTTSRGAKFSPMTVSRLCQRLEIKFP